MDAFPAVKYTHTGGALVKLIDDGTGRRFVHVDDKLIVHGMKTPYLSDAVCMRDFAHHGEFYIKANVI